MNKNLVDSAVHSILEGKNIREVLCGLSEAEHLDGETFIDVISKKKPTINGERWQFIVYKDYMLILCSKDYRADKEGFLDIALVRPLNDWLKKSFDLYSFPGTRRHISLRTMVSLPAEVKDFEAPANMYLVQAVKLDKIKEDIADEALGVKPKVRWKKRRPEAETMKKYADSLAPFIIKDLFKLLGLDDPERAKFVSSDGRKSDKLFINSCDIYLFYFEYPGEVPSPRSGVGRKAKAGLLNSTTIKRFCDKFDMEPVEKTDSVNMGYTVSVDNGVTTICVIWCVRSKDKREAWSH